MFDWEESDDDDLMIVGADPGYDDDDDPAFMVIESGAFPAQEITPRCACGGTFELSAKVREGVLVWDVESGVRIDLNKPDFFSGILGPVTVACKECGQEVELDLRVHPWSIGVGIEDSEGDVFYPG